MNRFDGRRKKRRFPGVLFSILLSCLILLLVLRGISSVSGAAARQEKESLTRAVYRSVIHSYASDGFYPPSLDYLREHYGLVWNEERYFIDYQPIGPNLMPDVTIIEREDPQ